MSGVPHDSSDRAAGTAPADARPGAHGASDPSNRFPRPSGDERVIGVAISIPEPYGTELQRWRATFGDPLADAIPTHVTLLPPTVVPTARLPEVEHHLLRVAAGTESFGMRLHGTATFRPVSPVVFVALAEGISSCEQLASAVRSGPLERELAFPYHPHVTVAHDLPEDMLDKAYRSLDGYACAFTVHAFSLYEHGADLVWRPQRDFALGGPLPGPFPDPGTSEPLP